MNTTTTGISTEVKIFCLVTWAMAMTATHLMGQVFTTLYNFGDSSVDGMYPVAGLTLSGKTLYGTTYHGGLEGSPGDGTVFEINTDGAGYKILYSFTGASDEAAPGTGLLLSGSNLYGASGGPGTTTGTLFALNTNGTVLRTLHEFAAIAAPDYTNGDGAFAWGQNALILSGNSLYGTTVNGGSGGGGVIFTVNTDGTGFAPLYNFTATSPIYDPYSSSGFSPPYSNSDGAYPYDGLILSDGTLYGATWGGGSSGWGTVFAINTNGTGFTNLYEFTGGSDGGSPNYTGSLILSGNTLYGATVYGGSEGNGTLFALNTNGTGFTNLYSFTAEVGPDATNADGALPSAGLILSGNTLYGATVYGGSEGDGTLFAINTNGTGFTNLHNFNGSSGGSTPLTALVLSGNTLYGTTYDGGYYGYGTIFSLSFPSPQLTIAPSGTNIILTWPSSYNGFSYSSYALQSTTNLGSAAAWTPVIPGPVVVNGQFTVTNPVSGAQQFYRIWQ